MPCGHNLLRKPLLRLCSDAGQRKLSSFCLLSSCLTCWLLFFVPLSASPHLLFCFHPTPSPLNGSYLKTKQSDDAFRQKGSLEKCRWGERKKGKKRKKGNWAVRQTGRGVYRQADGKNKILKENQSPTPSWAFLPIGQCGDQLDFRGGALPVRAKGRPPMWCVFVWACVCVHFVRKIKSTFTRMFSVHLWHLPVHTCACQTAYSLR